MKRITGRESSGACSLPNSFLHLIKKFSCFIILASIVFLGSALFSPDALQAADTGLRSPTSNLADTGGDGNGYQGSPSNAHADDTLNAVDTDSGSNTGTSCTGTDKDKHRFYDYSFSIPTGSTINGIEVRLDARADSTTGTPRICVQLSWDGGTTWTAVKTSANLTTTLATYTLGNATDNWGRAWSVNDFSNPNFRVRLINIASNISRDFTLDWVAVRVHYTASPTPPTITSTPVTTGNVGQVYSCQATATGTAPITWSLVSPPSGMTIGSTTGLVTWTPGAAGGFRVTVRATNSVGSVDQSYIIIVSTPADTGLRSPTVNAAETSSAGDNNGYQTSPGNAHGDDTLNAVDTDSGSNTGTSCTGTDKDKHRFYDYGFSIPGGSTVNGIEVRLDARADSTTGTPRICVQLSWDGGTTWTAAKTSANLTTTLATYTLGNATDTWGRAWNVNAFSNANFRVRLINIASNTSRDFTLDWVAVRVHYAVPPSSVLTLTKSGSGVGMVTSSPAGLDCGATCAASFTSGTSVTLTATPTSGSTFAGFSGGCTSAITTCIFTITANTTVTATFNDTEAPMVPSSLAAAVAGTNQINLSWSGSTDNMGVSGYWVERCQEVGCSDFARVNTSLMTGTTYSDAGLAADTTYRYRVQASDAVGNLSAYSNTATETTLPNPVLSLNKLGSGVGIVTSSPEGINCGTTCSASFASGTLVTLTAVADSGSTFTGFGNGCISATSPCTFTITANTTVTATFNDTQAPTVPSGLTATVMSTSQIDLSWSASTDNMGVTGYRVYRDGIELGTTPLLNASDTGLGAATTYSYTVSALDAAENLSAQSAPVTATTFAGTISGRVTQSNGTTPLVGAAVEFFQGPIAKGVVSTDSSGDYTFPAPSSGTYTVQASAVGYVTQNQTGIVVTVGGDTTADFSLNATPANNAISYTYDALGRLVGVVDPAGETATYAYDAVGNLLSITRQSSSIVSIIGFTPNSGPIGTSVTISGTGFSTTPSENTVTFNGVAANVTSATATQIVATVPAGTTSGPIAITNPNGSAISGAAFTVTSPISIQLNQTTATVTAGSSKQFTATITGTTDQRVLWRLEGVGAPVVGTLSSAGLYTVPSTFVDTAQVIVKAISMADPSKYATASVLVFPSAPFGPYTAPQVSVGIVQSPSPSGPFVAPQISVSLVPMIDTISPNSGAQGATDLLITLTGSGLSGATSLNFLRNGAVDTSITASNLTSNSEGTEATALLTISAAAPAGIRVIKITTSNGTSSGSATDGNSFNVTVP